MPKLRVRSVPKLRPPLRISYSDQGNLDKAISDYNEAIRLDPNFALAYYKRGNANLRSGNRAKARADFATADRLKSGR
jgi:tetratricopeptide (TPR) repeat protein